MRGGRSSGWIVALLVALSAGCGGDDDGASTTTEPPRAGVADDERSDDERADDLAIAEGAVLTLPDFPAGWEEGPVEPPEDDEELDAAMAECLGVPVEEFRPGNPQATSPTFTSPTDEEVDSRVAVTPSPDDAHRAFQMLSSDAAPGCYAEAIQALVTRNMLESDEVPDGLELGDVTFNQLSFEQVGDELLAYRATLPYEYQGFESQLEIDFVVVRVGRVGVNMSFASDGSSFDTDEARELTERVVARVEAADAG